MTRPGDDDDEEGLNSNAFIGHRVPQPSPPIHAHEFEIMMNSSFATNDRGSGDDGDEGAEISLQVSTGQTTDASCEMKME
jgi:hypothetical protein